MDFLKHAAFSESPFRMDSFHSIITPPHLGIAGDRLTVMTPPDGACRLRQLNNCPWTAQNFDLELRMDGERIPGDSWEWLPNAIVRRGRRPNWEARSLTVLPPERNCCVIRMEITNISGKPQCVPLQLAFGGSAKRQQNWEFSWPLPAQAHFAQVETLETAAGSVLVGKGTNNDVAGGPVGPEDAMIVITTSLKGLRLFRLADLWETECSLSAGETLCVDLSVHLGGQDGTVEAESQAVCGHWEQEIEAAFAWEKAEEDRIFANLPHMTSDNPELTALYYRSLVPHTLNRWVNPNYKINPFISTGSVTGGCMCSYLWDYGGGLMLTPVVDPQVNKEMIKGFLHADLSKCFAIMPLDGGPHGLWYHINQEKIVSMIYHHVLHTGDVDFLREEVDGKTIAQWTRGHACFHEDLSQPVALKDYGDAGKSHLELRRHLVYKGVMPDLNARRYVTYMQAYQLNALLGTPDESLRHRAEALKPLLETLWDEEAGWYDFIWEGKRQKRYTVQMFKFIDSDVIDDGVRKKLVSHLNETEFLSKFGLHSMSKLDEAYDQVDIDNGGGGGCTQFAMTVCGQLYNRGYAAQATDILNRCLWWGSRMPYLGDSLAANMVMHREDTPLQADISTTNCAQMMLFQMCGIRASLDGTIRVSPATVLPAKKIRLDRFRLLGREIGLDIDGDTFTVTADGRTCTAKLGETVII